MSPIPQTNGVTVSGDVVTSVISYHGGRAGELKRLNDDRNNTDLPAHRRIAAAKAHAKIRAQLEDRKLVSMRERLIKAARAGDDLEVAKITACIKDYMKEDRETGHYKV